MLHSQITKIVAVSGVLCVVAMSASAATVTVGPGGFDDGWATTITYDDAAARGTANDRANPLNALGAADGSFFEIGLGSAVDMTFGTLFEASATVYEITFGNPSNWAESVSLYVGNAGSFTFVETISNAAAVGGATSVLPSGTFDTIRLVDTSPLGSLTSGGFDIDAVRVTPAPVPLPASAAMLLVGLGGLAIWRRRATA